VVHSNAVAGNRFKLQFSYHDSTLPTRLADDIRRSSFSTRSKYLNALLEKMLSLPMRTSASSHVDELFAWLALFESLPIERIWQLAPTQNRNFDQMIKHLLEIALSCYPETPQLSVAARDLPLPLIDVHQLRSVDYGRWPDTHNRSPAINDFSS